MDEYLEGQKPDHHQLKDWCERFHRDGFLVIPNVLSKGRCQQLIKDLEAIVATGDPVNPYSFATRLFEQSQANLELFDLEPIVTFAEELIGDCNGPGIDPYRGIANANAVHVIHNNGFKMPGGEPGLANGSWHQDDTPHVLSLDGQPLTNIRLNVLAFTVNYYLTDVLTVENGPTQVIRGSHLFGKFCDGDVSPYQDRLVSCLGAAGTAVCFNNQVWHRGSPNSSSETRAITQVTYGKRLVGHKYDSIMNYEMPEHVYKDAKPRLKGLLGFLPPGAYS